MNVLIIGSGGREHAFAWKISQSSLCKKLVIAPGNGGTQDLGLNIDIDPNDFPSIKEICIEHNIDIVIVGPEDPLVNGIYDFFKSDDKLKEIIVIGPCSRGARLEGSKEFAKEFMQKYNIPTAKYKSFTIDNIEKGMTYLEEISSPYVLKVDGLAAGKGVLILDNLDEAKNELREIIVNKKFGDAGATVVVEEYLTGIELSVFVLTDGESYKILPSAKDYKRVGENDTGLNTGGMGAISPVPFVDRFFIDKLDREIIIPTIKGLISENILYQGFIFIGLMVNNGNAKVIEYNVRMGDPETEVVIPRIKSDLLNLLRGIGNGSFSEIDFDISEKTAATVILTSGGYPEKYQTGYSISGIEDADNSLVFHSGTKLTNKELLTSGGRVLAVTSIDNSIEAAVKKSMESCNKIKFNQKYYRKDIGKDLL